MVTFYANIRIKGGSRPLFLRPMGERGSAPEPSVIRIFAYPGYKGAYTGGFKSFFVPKASSFLQLFVPTSQASYESSHVGELCLCGSSFSVTQAESGLRFCQSVCGELLELVDRELVELGELVDGELVDGSATLGARSGKSRLLFFFLGVLCK